MTTILAGTLQGVIRPPTTEGADHHRAPVSEPLDLLALSLPERLSRTMSETADATMEPAATMLPATPTTPTTGPSTP